MSRRTRLQRWLDRGRTVSQLVAHFAKGHRLFLLPLLLVLLLAAVLLMLTGGLSYVTPFLYAIF
ncbi:DUF5989 family protein [Comamonas sp. JC664]|uniref:DUF5989 family protein n=1 Tax=Comamonas sp. JC664 TaxID=2801917 RepID=UPI0017496536|nr:DUF5989 family protein [Comamonas sp. JC664]MBL0698041.1 hypothetical protein [Comamonas sp. JC664]GHG70993.1 hypothetical protein GCM10012319_16430 [Comamonas sp. KCTC 72670]